MLTQSGKIDEMLAPVVGIERAIFGATATDDAAPKVAHARLPGAQCPQAP